MFPRLRLCQPQMPILNAKQLTRRNHVNPVCFDRHPFGRLRYLHRGHLPQQVDDPALLPGRQVLRNDKRQTCVRRQIREERLECFQAPRRCADCDD